MRLLFIAALFCSSVASAAITGPVNCAYGYTSSGATVQTGFFYVGSSSNCTSGSPTSNVAGNAIVVYFGYVVGTTTLPASVTDIQGNAYAAGAIKSNYDGAYSGFYVSCGVAGGSGNKVTVTLGASESFFYVYVEEYSGTLPSACVDAQAISQGYGSSISLAVTTTSANELILNNVNSNGVTLGTVTPYSGYSLGYIGNTDYFTQNAVVGAAGTYTSVPSWNCGVGCSAHVAAASISLIPTVAAASFNVVHANGSITTWSPDGWGDGTTSTSTGGFSGALDNAVGGDTIILHHMTTYARPTNCATTSGTNCFILLPNFAGTATVTITGDDNAAVPPSGQRVVTGYSPTPPSFLPLIQMESCTSTATGYLCFFGAQPLVEAACGAHDFTFQGVAFGIASGGAVGTSSSLVMGSSLSGALAPQCVPRRLVFDRVWAAGNYNQPGPCHAFVFDVNDSKIINSYMDEFKEYGQDCQAVYMTTGQNVLLQNNWMASSTENFMCGGSGPTTAGYLCNHVSIIGDYHPKHMQWRVFASNTTPQIGDARSSCLYYPPDLNYDGIGGGEIWVNGTSSCSGNGAFPPAGGGVGPGTYTTGPFYECQANGTWPSTAYASKAFNCSYGTAVQTGGQSGNEKDNLEFKEGQDMWIWGTVLANMWNSLQSELFIPNGPVTAPNGVLCQPPTVPVANTPCADWGSHTLHGITLEYSILRDGYEGLANGAGFPGPDVDPIYGIKEQHLLLDNVAQANRGCDGCSYNSVPAQSSGLGVFGGAFTYNTYGGCVNTSGTAVTWAACSGSETFNTTWGGKPILINGVTYTVASSSYMSLTLTTSAGTQTGVPYSFVTPLVAPGGWVSRHNTAVNSASTGSTLKAAGSIDFDSSILSPYSPAGASPLAISYLDNVFSMGGGIGGQNGGGSTSAQVFNAGGAFFGVGSPPSYRYWAPGTTLAYNIISEDTAIGGTAFTGTTGLYGTNGPGLNGVGQGTSMAPGGTATSSCCFTNYLPAIMPTIVAPQPPNTNPEVFTQGSTWQWTYTDTFHNYALSTGGAACNPAGTNTTGAPTGTCTGVASDGTNPGADLQTVYGFTANAIGGQNNPNLAFRVNPPIRQSSSSVVISYQAPLGDGACTVVVSNNENLTISPQGTHTQTGTAPEFIDTITGLSGNFFWYSVACGDVVNGGGAMLTRKNFFQL